MTKFDLASWFCRAIALVGMISGGLLLLSSPIGLLFRAPQLMGNVLGNAISFATFLFLWLFADGAGSALTGEDRHNGTPLTRQNMGTLALQCAGFWLLLNGFIATGQIGFGLITMRFSSSSMWPSYYSMMLPNLFIGFAQAIVGFLMAFGPRFLRLVRSP